MYHVNGVTLAQRENLVWRRKDAFFGDGIYIVFDETIVTVKLVSRRDIEYQWIIGDHKILSLTRVDC